MAGVGCVKLLLLSDCLPGISLLVIFLCGGLYALVYVILQLFCN